MQRTEAQIEASRINGSRSRGPVTAEGKAISSRNALKHGIRAATVVVFGESEDAYTEILDGLMQEFEPATIFEESLVRTMAAALFRQERTLNNQRSSLNMQMASDQKKYPQIANRPDALNAWAFRTLGNETRTLDLILRYEAHYDRKYLRAHKRLVEAQNARLNTDPNHPKPAKGKVIPINRASEQGDSSKLPNKPETAPLKTMIAATDSTSNLEGSQTMTAPRLAAAPHSATKLPNEPNSPQIDGHLHPLPVAALLTKFAPAASRIHA